MGSPPVLITIIYHQGPLFKNTINILINVVGFDIFIQAFYLAIIIIGGMVVLGFLWGLMSPGSNRENTTKRNKGKIERIAAKINKKRREEIKNPASFHPQFPVSSHLQYAKIHVFTIAATS
jgi:hypothetical protein